MESNLFIRKVSFIIQNYFIPIVLTIGISIIFFSLFISVADKKEDSFSTFVALSNGFEEYYAFKTAWKPRLFSTALATLFVDVFKYNMLSATDVVIGKAGVGIIIGSWSVGWFALISFVLITTLKKRAVFYIIGLFAGLSFGYQVFYGTVIRVYSWDMPVLFIYVLFLILFINKKYNWLLAVISLGVGFKETTIILCFGFLFADLPLKRRILMFASGLGLSIIIKILIDIYVQAPLFFTMEYGLLDKNFMGSYMLRNLRNFKEVIPLFSNAGLIIILFLCPNLNKEIVALKFIAVIFIVGNTLFGIVTEYRVWFEIIPFGLYALDTTIYDNTSFQ